METAADDGGRPEGRVGARVVLVMRPHHFDVELIAREWEGLKNGMRRMPITLNSPEPTDGKAASAGTCT
jgi:hypothetical protein